MTNHQTLLFALPALMMAIAFRDLRLVRDCMAGGLWLIACLLCFKAGAFGFEGLSDANQAIQNSRLQAAGALVALGWAFLLIDDRIPRKWVRPVEQWIVLGVPAIGLCALACYGLFQAGGYGQIKFLLPEANQDAIERWFKITWVVLASTGLIAGVKYHRTAAGKNRALHRTAVGQAVLALALLIAYQFARSTTSDPSVGETDPIGTGGLMVGYILLALIALGGAIAIAQRTLLTQWKRFVIVVFLVSLGLSFYLYLPIASDQNPPMNWGYARTEEGFWHALSRGQYERFDVLENAKSIFTNPRHYLDMVGAVFLNPAAAMSLVAQFTPFLIPFALLGLGAMVILRRRERLWMLVTLITFFFMTLVFVIVQWPDLDIQTLFIGRVQYIQAHALYALWISYGLIFGLALLDSWRPGSKAVQYLGIGFVFLLPLLLIHRNARDEEYLRVTGGAEQNGRDFGWQFGNYQLRGIEGILDELSPDEPPPPSPTYPPPMEPDAILFGGTDPGRFVPTYMIYSAKVRPDVFLITQNALADNTYMAVMRDLYGDDIWIPSMEDSNLAFRRYVDDVRTGRIASGASVTEQDGRVSVQGVGGVMMINGLLTRQIFDQNKHKHAFYVEESYVIPWMYPYLTPHGLIMKINPEPVASFPAELVRNDREFWTWFVERLKNHPKFDRDVLAQKTFSKLRSAIAGLYVHRRNYPEAEFAFQQAVELYDLSPEANFRLAEAYTQQRKFDEAIAVIETFLERDPENEKVRVYLNQLRLISTRDKRRQELEPLLAEGTTLSTALELLKIYRGLGQHTPFDTLARRLVTDPKVSASVCHQVGAISTQFRRFESAVEAFSQAGKREPNQYTHWLELAAARLGNRQPQESLQAIHQAVQRGGDTARRAIREDQRFDPIRNAPAFQQLVPDLGTHSAPTGGLTIPFGPRR